MWIHADQDPQPCYIACQQSSIKLSNSWDGELSAEHKILRTSLWQVSTNFFIMLERVENVVHNFLSHQGFPAILRKKCCKILKKFCIVILAFLKGFKNEIFCNLIQNPKNLLSFQTVKKYFLAPFLLLLVEIWGRTATNISRPKDIFCGPFRVIWQNFRPPGNSDAEHANLT